MQSEEFMRRAIEEAQKGVGTGQGIGFGSVIVKDGAIIAAAHDTVSFVKDPTAHAEVNAIRAACATLNATHLTGCELYTTCEPCPMCFTAAWWAGVSTVISGANLADVTTLSREMLVDSEYLNEKGGGTITIKKEFLRDECLVLYQPQP